MSNPDTLPADPMLPHLPLALNGVAMTEVFASLVRAHRPGLIVQACAVDRIKYRPRRNLAVSYRLRLRESGSGETVEQLVATRFCVPGESEPRHAKAHRCEAVPSHVGLGHSHVAHLGMVAAWWPNDPKLGSAAALLGAGFHSQEGVLRAVIGAMTRGRGVLASHQVQMAQSVPEHRACARVELAYREADSGPPQHRTVFVKTDAERRGGVTHSVLQALHRCPAQAAGRLLTPQPLLWQPEHNLHWQAALPGIALLDESPQVSGIASSRVGAMLAALHATPVATPRCVGAAELRERIGLVARTLVVVEPRWAGAVLGLVGALTEGTSAACAAEVVTLHGDLHPRNVLVAGARTGLIDLDSVRRGPAVADLGDWIADALYRALLGEPQGGQSVAAALTACRAFVRAYVGETGAPCSEALLAWSTANSLFCQRAWRCVVNLKPGRYALIEPLLDTAAAILRAGSIDAALETPQRLAA
jgi:Phosphotransferase enzyme family